MYKTISVRLSDIVSSVEMLTWLGNQKLPSGKLLPFIMFRKSANNYIKAFNEARDSIVARYGFSGSVISQNSPLGLEVISLLNNVVELPDPELTWENVKDIFGSDGRANYLESLLWLIHDVPI